MPVLSEKYKDHWRNINSKPNLLEFCWGANVIYYRYPVRNENGPTAVFQYMWKGQTFVTVETDYYDEEQMRGVWFDVDGDGKAEEFYNTPKELLDRFEIEGNGTCPIVKHVLKYWRH